MVKKKKKKKRVEEKKKVTLKNYQIDLIILAIFLLLLVFLFKGFIFSNLMLYGSDTIQAGVFMRDFYVDYFKEHHAIPLWDPFIFGGMPYVDAFHGDTFYPLTFLKFFIKPLFRALGWGLILHFFLAGLFMYLCAQVLGLRKFYAAFSALVYMFSTYLISMVHPGHDGKIFVTALLPLAFLFLEKGFNTKKFSYFILLGGTLGLIILTPHPQMAYFTCWALGGYFLYRLIFLFKDYKKLSLLIKPTLFFITAVLLGLSLSAIHLLPGFIYVKKYSPRAGEGRGYEFATSWSLHQEELVSQVVPEFCGYDLEKEQTYWGKNYFKDNCEYGGLIPLIFAGILFGFKRKRLVWFFSGLSIFTLIYALGDTTPLFRIFYHLIPNVKSLRAPSMIMFLFIFSVAFLGGKGIEYITEKFKEEKENRKRKLIKGISILCVIFCFLSFLFLLAPQLLLSIWTSIFQGGLNPRWKQALYNNIPNIQAGFWITASLLILVTLSIYFYFKESLKKRVFLSVIVFLAIVDLWRMDYKFIQVVDFQMYFAKDPAVDFLKNDKSVFRSFPLPGTFRDNYLAYFRLEEVGGYHGNQLQRYKEFVGGDNLQNLNNFNLLNLLNTKYFLFRKGINIKGEIENPQLEKVFDQNNVVIYENKGFLPRARIVFDYEIIKDEEKILERLKDQEFDYRNKIILEKLPEINFASVDTTQKSGSAKIIEKQINSLTIEAKLSQPSFLVLSENFYPAWKAFVDGKETEIYRANYTFRAVFLNKESHQIKFVFDSPYYKIAKRVSGISLLFIFFGLFFSFLKKPLYRKILRGR